MTSIKTELLERYGKIYNTDQAMDVYTFQGFMAPRVQVVRKSDGVKGSLRFIHSPRYYFDFQAY
jgi:hypothetical protein